MNLEQIKAAVERGETVHWRNEAYRVEKDSIGQWWIVCQSKDLTHGSTIGLTWKDGKTLNGKESEFFCAGPVTQAKLAEGLQNLRGLKDRACFDIAEALGLSYSGDCSLIHGGCFWNPADWDKYGYAEAVRVMADDGHLFLTVGQIHRSDVDSALACCGWKRETAAGPIVNDYDGATVAEGPEAVRDCIISACESYAGVEPCEDFSGRSDWACPIDEDSNTFKHEGKAISLDDLEGWVVRRFLIGLLPID